MQADKKCPSNIFLICCGHMTLWCYSCFPMIGYKFHTRIFHRHLILYYYYYIIILYAYGIFNYYCIGTTFELQDIIKQWQRSCLLAMCTTDACVSKVTKLRPNDRELNPLPIVWEPPYPHGQFWIAYLFPRASNYWKKNLEIFSFNPSYCQWRMQKSICC